MTAALAVRMSAIDKRFGAVRASRGASLEVEVGEIHALVGENGAGKSTLLRILGGIERCEAGSVEVGGRDVTNWTTARAIAAGVAMVHQHFMLVPTLTVAENLVLGTEAGVLLDRAGAVREVEALCAESGLVVVADRLVADLTVGEAQRVEILKALHRRARVLLLDEPTAVLSPPEVQELWKVLRRLRDRGTTIVLVTHRLDEVMQISASVTVMRQGATVAHWKTSETTPEKLAHAMVGRDVALVGTAGAARAPGRAATGTHAAHGSALDVRDLVVRGARIERAVDGVSFTVRPGEILGIAGVEGNGQTELVESLAGLRAATSGSIRIGERDVTRLRVQERVDLGLAHVPEDRQLRGLVLDASVAENLVLGAQRQFTRTGVLDRAAIATVARECIAAFDIRPADSALHVRTLSGGNQQKVVIARELSRPFQVLLAAQPTRGVDVGAIEEIHRALRAARDDGKAILLVSAELGELLALADRIAVMSRGRFVALLPRDEANEEVLGRFMTGAKGEARP